MSPADPSERRGWEPRPASEPTLGHSVHEVVDERVDEVVDEVVEQAAALLRSRGDRMTGPRRAVIAALAARAPSHLTPDQVVTGVAELDATVHRASVYRALEVLSTLGVVQHVHLGHGTTAYHLAAPHEHLHAHCVRCDRVFDLPGSLLDDVAHLVADEYGFVLDPAHVALSGTCASCRADSDRSSSGG